MAYNYPNNWLCVECGSQNIYVVYNVGKCVMCGSEDVKERDEQEQGEGE